MSFEKLKNLDNQIAVITGANGKIGRAICKRLAELGATVYGIVRNQQEELQNFLNILGPTHRAILCDVTDSKRLNEVAKEFTRCDILINTAGKSKIISHSNLIDLSEEEFNNLIRTNLTSVYLTIQAFLNALKESKNALVINISSASSIRGGGSNVAYTAAKAGVDSLTKNFAIAFSPNIRFIALNPGMVNTGFVSFSHDQINQATKNTPLKRITTVDDIANTVEAFATVLRFTTGNRFVIDGGQYQS